MIDKKIIARFESKIIKEDHTSCWNWGAGCSGDGYGAFSYKGKTERAHRISWMLYNGDIPEGLLICHKCDNPKCVNPNHLLVGTQSENIIDMNNKNRGNQLMGENHPDHDTKDYLFINKARGWKIRCKRHYMKDVFKLCKKHLAMMINGNADSVQGWTLAGKP